MVPSGGLSPFLARFPWAFSAQGRRLPGRIARLIDHYSGHDSAPQYHRAQRLFLFPAVDDMSCCLVVVEKESGMRTSKITLNGIRYLNYFFPA